MAGRKLTRKLEQIFLDSYFLNERKTLSDNDNGLSIQAIAAATVKTMVYYVELRDKGSRTLLKQS